MTQPNGAPQFDPARALADRIASFSPQEAADFAVHLQALGGVATGANVDPGNTAPAAPAGTDPNAPVIPGFGSQPTIPVGGINPGFNGQPAPNVQPKPSEAEEAAKKEAYEKELGKWSAAPGNVYFYDPSNMQKDPNSDGYIPEWVPTAKGEKMNDNLKGRPDVRKTEWMSRSTNHGSNKDGVIEVTKISDVYPSDYTGAESDKKPGKEKPGIVVFDFAIDGRPVKRKGQSDSEAYACGWQIVLDKKQAKQFEQFLRDNPNAATDIMKRMVKDNFADDDKKIWDIVKPKYKEAGAPIIDVAEPTEPVENAGPIKVTFGEDEPSYEEYVDAATRAAREAELTHELGQKYKMPLTHAQQIAKYAMSRIGRNLTNDQEKKAEEMLYELAESQYKDINKRVNKLEKIEKSGKLGRFPSVIDATTPADELLVAILRKNGVALEDMGKYGVTYQTLRELNKRNSKLGAVMERYALWQTPARRIGRIAMWRANRDAMKVPITPAEQNEGLGILPPRRELTPVDIRNYVLNELHFRRSMPEADATPIAAYAAARNSGIATPESLEKLAAGVGEVINNSYKGIAAKHPTGKEVKGLVYGADIDFALVPLLAYGQVPLEDFTTFGVTPETVEQLSDRNSALSKFMEKKGLWTRPDKATRRAA
jgi:hypothetical protein